MFPSIHFPYGVILMLKPSARPGSLPPLETPQISPKGYVEQIVGVMNVSVTYSRLGMRGRKIFGGLVQYGKPWRTGANEFTTIAFSDRVKVEGHDLPAGSYSLFTIPGEQEWVIIINKKTTGMQRDEKEDLLSFKVKPSHTSIPLETFTINIADVATNTANVELAWENTVVKFRIEFEVDSRVIASMQKVMENPYADVAFTYYQSASYYFSTGRDLKTAFDWVNKSLELKYDFYWVWRMKSLIQAGLKDYTGAIASAELSKQKAMAMGNEQMVKTNDDAIAEWKTMK